MRVAVQHTNTKTAAESGPGGLAIKHSGESVSLRSQGLDLPRELTTAHLELAKMLDEGSRLYKKSDSGGLALISGGEALERLLAGQPIEIVTVLPGEIESSHSSSSSSRSAAQGLSSRESNHEEQSRSSRTVEVQFNSKSVSSLLGLMATSLRGSGLGGVGALPAANGKVTVAFDFESHRTQVDVASWGIFRPRSRATESKEATQLKLRNDAFDPEG